MTTRIHTSLGAAVVAALLLLPSTSGATTWCVDGAGHCSGVAVTGANVEMTAMGPVPLRSDGVADRIQFPAGVYTDPNSWNIQGSDPLDVSGLGSTTVLTSSTNVASFVVDAGNGPGGVALRNLKIRIPPSMPDNDGGALEAKAPNLTNVDVDSANPGSSGLAFVGGGVLSGGTLQGVSGGSIGVGIQTADGGFSTSVNVDGVTVSAAAPVVATAAGTPIDVRDSELTSTSLLGAATAAGGSLVVTNSIVHNTNGPALRVLADVPSSLLTADHVTGTAAGSGFWALQSDVNPGGTGTSTLAVSNSVFRGWASGTSCSASSGPATGDATISVKYSDLSSGGTSAGDCHVTQTQGVLLDVDPKFTSPTDLRLQAGSPAVDAGDPGFAGALTDYAALDRVTDGDGNGSAVTDLGAYERPAAPAQGGGGGGGGGGSASKPAEPAEPVTPTAPSSDAPPAQPVAPAPAVRPAPFTAAGVLMLGVGVDRRSRALVRVTNGNVMAVSVDLALQGGNGRAAAALSIRSGASRTIALTLTRSQRARLRRTGHVTLRLTAHLRSAAGATTTVHRTVRVARAG